MLRPRTVESEFYALLETQLSQTLYPKEGDDVVEPQNIEDEIDLVESTAKQAGVFNDGKKAEAEPDPRSWKNYLWSDESDDEDEEHVSDTQHPFQVYV